MTGEDWRSNFWNQRERLRLWHSLHQEGDRPVHDLLFQSARWWVTEQTPLSPGEVDIWVSVLGVWPGAGRGPNIIAEGRTRVAFSTSSIPGNAQSFVACDLFQPTAGFRGGRKTWSDVSVWNWLGHFLLGKQVSGGFNSLIKLILTGCPLPSLFTKTIYVATVTTGESRVP